MNELGYLIISIIAYDLLIPPVSIIVLEFAFSVGVTIMSNYMFRHKEIYWKIVLHAEINIVHQGSMSTTTGSIA